MVCDPLFDRWLHYSSTRCSVVSVSCESSDDWSPWSLVGWTGDPVRVPFRLGLPFCMCNLTRLERGERSAEERSTQSMTQSQSDSSHTLQTPRACVATSEELVAEDNYGKEMSFRAKPHTRGLHTVSNLHNETTSLSDDRVTPTCYESRHSSARLPCSESRARERRAHDRVTLTRGTRHRCHHDARTAQGSECCRESRPNTRRGTDQGAARRGAVVLQQPPRLQQPMT